MDRKPAPEGDHRIELDRAEQGMTGLSLSGITWMSAIILGIALFEITRARRWWCRYICPGGALWGLIGAKRPIRVKHDAQACTRCTNCVKACPVGLNPMDDKMGIDCDNCGRCISHCNDHALAYGFQIRPTRPLLVLLFFTLGLIPNAMAHHILGIPHYSYDERYPQAPVLTYLADAGDYEVQMTGYPGKPQPGQRCEFHVYVRAKDGGEAFTGPVACTAFLDRLIGEDPSIYGPIEGHLDQGVYKFYPRFEQEATYTLRIAFETKKANAAAEPWIIDLPTVAGEPGYPWVVLGAVAGGMATLLVVVRAIHIKRQRGQGVAPTS